MMMCLGTRSSLWSLICSFSSSPEYWPSSSCSTSKRTRSLMPHSARDRSPHSGSGRTSCWTAPAEADRPPRMTTSATPTVSSRRASSLLSRWPSSKSSLAGSGVCHGLGQLVAGDPLPEGQLLIELVPAHNGQIVAPGIEEQVVHQGLGSFHRGGLAGTELAVDLQHGVLIRLAGVLLQSSRDAGIVAEAVQDLARRS